MKHSRLSVSTACGLVIAISSLMFADRALGAGPTETTLYSFLGGSDGANSAAPLVFDKAGNIYGTTQSGGAFSCGTVFELTPPATQGGAWTETILYSFTGGPDGQLPSSGLILDSKGALYGETIYGGHDISGTVFRLTPPAVQGGPWTETTIHEFCKAGNPCIDGARPAGGLVFDKKGNLYGTASIGGNAATGCCGSVFRLTPHAGGKWTESVLYIFNGGTDGYQPNTGVTFDTAGNLYGTTPNGGGCSAYLEGCGVVFELTPAVGAWTESILYRFQGGADGFFPTSGVILDKSGALYGTTSAYGGLTNGTVFRMSPPAVQGGPWTESVLYTFQGLNGALDGYDPVGGVIFDGKDLFGTTYFGGSALCGLNGFINGCGTVFELVPPKTGTGAWTESILWNFATPNGGAYPAAALKIRNGAFYGTASSGGNACQCGTVFELVP